MTDDELTDPARVAEEARPDAAPAGEATGETTPPAASEADHARTRGAGHTAAVVSLRVVRGLAGVAAAAATVAAVGLIAPPVAGIAPLGMTVEPQPAELSAVCTGSLLRLGDETGANAGEAFAVGLPSLSTAASASPDRAAVDAGDVTGAGAGQAPASLTLPPGDGAVLGAAQSQQPGGDGELVGLAATICTEPTSSAWLVGGATTLGRTTLLLLTNPTGVAAEVSVTMWGESGDISAPGMTGISVPANGRRVLSLAGFAPGLASPVVHVEARGGQITAALQTSAMRVLDPGGVDVVAPGAAPAREVIIPGVRIFDGAGVASSLGIEGYGDLDAIVRVANPGIESANVEVSITPTDPAAAGTAFELEIPGGRVLDTPLAAGLPLGADPLADGSYTVTLSSDQPVVGAVRTATIPAPDGEAGELRPGAADVAWFAAAPVLRGAVAVPVADAPAPVLVVAASDGQARELTLVALDGGPDIPLPVPAVGSIALALQPGSSYRLDGSGGVVAALGFAGESAVAGYPLTAPRKGDSPIVVRP